MLRARSVAPADALHVERAVIARGDRQLPTRLRAPRSVLPAARVSPDAGRSPPRAIALLVLLLSPACQCDQCDLPAPRLLANGPAGIQAVHARHADIHDDQIGSELLGDSYRIHSVVGGFGLVPHDLQQHREREGGVVIVVHHENAMNVRPAGGFRRRAWPEASISDCAAGSRTVNRLPVPGPSLCR